MAKTKTKTPKYAHDGIWTRGDAEWYVRCWKEKREWVVQVWNATTPEGDPAGDWAMPGVLGMTAAIEQAIIQTPTVKT